MKSYSVKESSCYWEFARVAISSQLKTRYKEQLIKAIGHLEKSFNKASKLPTVLSENDDDSLETWESFTSRFSRVVDLYTTKVLRAQILDEDPAFDGSFKDLLLLAEKVRFISSAEEWLKLRSLRNIQAHDYTDESFSNFANELLKMAPTLINLKF